MARIPEGASITIQSWMISELGLSGNELLVYAVIHTASQDGRSWFCNSKGYIAEWAGCSERTVFNCLNHLMSKGLIVQRKSASDGCWAYDYAVTRKPSGQEKTSKRGGKNCVEGGKNCHPWGGKNCHTNKTNCKPSSVTCKQVPHTAVSRERMNELTAHARVPQSETNPKDRVEVASEEPIGERTKGLFLELWGNIPLGERRNGTQTFGYQLRMCAKYLGELERSSALTDSDLARFLKDHMTKQAHRNLSYWLSDNMEELMIDLEAENRWHTDPQEFLWRKF